MTRETVLARGRALAEAGMDDACLITRDVSGVTNMTTGARTPSAEVIYEGPCRIQQPEASAGAASNDQAGPAQVLLLGRTLQLPVPTSIGVRAGDQVVLTAAVNDADLLGRTFVVRSEAAKSEATSRRIGIEEATS